MSLNGVLSCECTFHPEVRNQQPCSRFSELCLVESIGVRRMLEFLMYCCEQLPGIFFPFLFCARPNIQRCFYLTVIVLSFRELPLIYFECLFCFCTCCKVQNFFPRRLENRKWMYICVLDIVFKFREKWCQRHFFVYILLFPVSLIFLSLP